jgi:hypothetical protein
VQLDLIRGTVRIGFTKEQVEIAHQGYPGQRGAPLSRTSEETAAGVTETWVYVDAVIVFRAGKVTKITKVEQ